MSKFAQKNIYELQRLKQGNAKNSSKATVKEPMKSSNYTLKGKCSNCGNQIKGLTSDDKWTYDKAFQKYKDNTKKFKEAKPIQERVAETKERNKDKTYFVNSQIYTRRSPRNKNEKCLSKKWC